MNLKDFSTFKKVLLYGYGTEGRSSEKFFQKHFSHLEISIFDDSLNSKSREFEQYDAIIRSPGVPKEKITPISPKKITSQTELFFASLNEKQRKKIIGITGTKGKSTTTKFCSEFLDRAGHSVGIIGNFGIPPLEVWQDFENGKYDFLVAEFSSFQLESVRHSPHIAIVLNLFADHLDRHKSIEKYHDAKKNIVQYQKKNDILILPEEMKSVFDISTYKSHILYSKTFPKKYFPLNSSFRALHFRQNLGTLLSLCDVLKIDQSFLYQTAKYFQGLPHRMEFFAEKNGIRFVNDAIATNPKASLAAVTFFGKNLGSIILGGTPSGDSWKNLLQKIKNDTSSILLLPEGKSLHEISATLHQIDFPQNRIFGGENLTEIVKIALTHTPKGMVCLLSPGAKSFDRFENYRQKGDTFKKLIHNSCVE
jgi:UDP-N-acetylmuramoylalanine--D-glutamate ligase